MPLPSHSNQKVLQILLNVAWEAKITHHCKLLVSVVCPLPRHIQPLAGYHQDLSPDSYPPSNLHNLIPSTHLALTMWHLKLKTCGDYRYSSMVEHVLHICKPLSSTPRTYKCGGTHTPWKLRDNLEF